ncbi:unnamed protein product [Enterobius vermicularis]|uniref:Neur_chan_LBD domain-containing protein n=1 Tax=Enterobius vermicularis TaxID=51028 RepID=A0A0N4VMN0_ENTVE|nr:unnamed protein product [Enterobius vermicularis]
MLFLAYVLSSTVIANIDVPVIIDREFSRQVDPADFLIDYDAERPPSSLVKVDVIFDVKYLKWKPETVDIILELTQGWEDARLTLPGGMSIFVPKDRRLWLPDSYFENAVEVEWQRDHSRRLNRGVIYEKQRVKLVVPCIEQRYSNETVR